MELTWKSFGELLSSGLKLVFDTIVGTLKKSYEASHRWFAIGCGIFVLLVWFGYAHLPTFSSKDSALEKQVAELKVAIVDLKTSIDALKPPAPIVTGSIKKKLR